LFFMSIKDGKSNNEELYEIDAMLSGVEPDDTSVEDILSEVYGTKPAEAPESEETAPPEPQEPEEQEATPAEEPPAKKVVPIPVITDDDSDPPDIFAEPSRKKARQNVVSFPGGEKSDPQKKPAAPAQPISTELPQELLDAVFDEVASEKPEGYTPRKPRKRPTVKPSAPPAAAPEDYRAAAPAVEPQPQHAPEEGRISKLKAKADAFADSMFSQAAGTDEETEMAERYIPGTDVEQLPPDIPEETEPPKKEPKPKRERPPKKDCPPQKMARIYFSGLRFMAQRLRIMTILTLISAYLTVGSETFIPIPSVLTTQPRILVIIQLVLLAVSLVFSFDTIRGSFIKLKNRLFGLDTLASVSVLFTVADAVLFCVTERSGPLPYCTAAQLVLLCYTWGNYDRKMANYLACRQASHTPNPLRVTKDHKLWNNRDTFTKADGDAHNFGAQMQAPSGADLLQTKFAPFLLIAGILLGALAGLRSGHPERILWCLSAILTAAAPLSGLLCYGQPWLRLTQRLEKSGSAVAGWPGIDSASGAGGVLITDSDLYPPETVKISGMRKYGDVPLEKVTSCAASLIRMSGSGLTELFENLVEDQGGFARHVDNFQCYEAGGLSGTIRGELVLVGNVNFMTMMDVPLPQDLKVKNAVYCAIDGSLRGIFAVNYLKSSTVKPAVQALMQTKLIPVLVPRDFNVTPAEIRQRLRIPVEKMEYPPVERRLELSDPDQEHNETLCALMNRDSIETYAETIVGCRRMGKFMYASCLLALLASLVGLVLGFFLTSMAAFTSLSATNLLIFLLIWLVPSLMLSGNVNRY
jgi:hypothetical protein